MSAPIAEITWRTFLGEVELMLEAQGRFFGARRRGDDARDLLEEAKAREREVKASIKRLKIQLAGQAGLFDRGRP